MPLLLVVLLLPLLVLYSRTRVLFTRAGARAAITARAASIASVVAMALTRVLVLLLYHHDLHSGKHRYHAIAP